jgi:hypothetical protein
MRLSQFKSAKIVEGGKVRVKGPTGDANGDSDWHPATPVHFAIVRDGHVLTGTGKWNNSGEWSGTSDNGVPGLTAGESYAFALEVRFWWESPGGGFEDAGGYQTYAWSQEIDLEED